MKRLNKKQIIPNLTVVISGFPFKTKFGGFGYSSISLIQDAGSNILFDVGHYAVREKMKELIKRKRIDHVFLSHLHYDHCLNIDLFAGSKAKIYVNRKEWEYLDYIRPDDNYTFRFFKQIVPKQNLILFDKDFQISTNVRAIETIGHTIGHSSLILRWKGKSTILAGDAIKTYHEFCGNVVSNPRPYDAASCKMVKKYIRENFDIIIPGHSSAIIKGKSRSDNWRLRPL